jgi:hypothetical protein
MSSSFPSKLDTVCYIDKAGRPLDAIVVQIFPDAAGNPDTLGLAILDRERGVLSYEAPVWPGQSNDTWHVED